MGHSLSLLCNIIAAFSNDYNRNFSLTLSNTINIFFNFACKQKDYFNIIKLGLDWWNGNEFIFHKQTVKENKLIPNAIIILGLLLNSRKSLLCYDLLFSKK